MGQTTNTIPPGGYKILLGSDFAKGIGFILFGAFTSIGILALSQDHFPTWAEIRPIALMAFTTLTGYISKNYFTNNEGKMFQQDAPVTTVPAQALDEVVKQANEK